MKKYSLEDRLSTQAGVDSQEEDGNTTKSSKWLHKERSNERMLDNLTVSLGETKRIENASAVDGD